MHVITVAFMVQYVVDLFYYILFYIYVIFFVATVLQCEETINFFSNKKKCLTEDLNVPKVFDLCEVRAS